VHLSCNFIYFLFLNFRVKIIKWDHQHVVLYGTFRIRPSLVFAISLDGTFKLLIWVLIYISRGINSVSHLLANIRRSQTITMTWSNSGPEDSCWFGPSGSFIFLCMDIGYANYNIHIRIGWIIHLNACFFLVAICYYHNLVKVAMCLHHNKFSVALKWSNHARLLCCARLLRRNNILSP
jgi:hypothetical protein